MSIFLIIVSCVLWLSAIALLWGRQIAAPIASFLGLLCISFARSNGYPLLPVNGTIPGCSMTMNMTTSDMQSHPVRIVPFTGSNG